jgi:hypothetical protein
MTTRRISAAMMIDFDEAVVERASPDSPPTAFRIWRAGANPTDHGMSIFSERSASLIMQEQEQRGVLISIDIDHMSQLNDAPPLNHRALGWHKLAVRPSDYGSELWAVDVEWAPSIAEGLTKKPPEWRYFSPCYDIDKSTNEIVRYINTALTNTPATWQVTQLAARVAASSKGSNMKASKVAALKGALAALTAMASGDGPENEPLRNAMAAIKAVMEDDDEEPPNAAPKEEKPAEEKASEAKEEKASEAEDDKAEDKRQAASMKSADIIELARKVHTLEAEAQQAKQDQERARLLATRPDFSSEVRRVLAAAPLSVLQSAVKSFPKVEVLVPSTVTASATRGETQGQGSVVNRGLPPADHQRLMCRMGLVKETPKVQWDESGHDRVFPMSVSRDEAKRILDSNRAKMEEIQKFADNKGQVAK